ncbi:MAG: cobalamin adenosyltransferase [Desulfobacter sp.]|nr:MAG: cobalamin adenosyltransferase [Desulfobacter sp.]
MKFITEFTLRDLYRKGAFTEYELGADARLTPGGRSFLSDKRIRLIEPGAPVKKKAWEKKADTVTPDGAEAAAQAADRPSAGPSADKMLAARARSLENLFLETGYDFLETDVNFAKTIMELSPAVGAIRNMILGETPEQSLDCTACTKINQDNFDQDLGECFEITPFHIQSKNGRQILKLDKLRCAVYELAVLAEASNHPAGKDDDLYRRVNRVANVLSQMICTAFGGKECLRDA